MEDFWKKVAREKKNIRFKQARSFSPYSEYSKNWLVEKDGVSEITFNALYRYDLILEPLLKNEALSVEKKEWLFDIMVHYLTELEYRNGMDADELAGREWMEHLFQGDYGEKIRRIYEQCERTEQYYIASMLQRQNKNGASVALFCECLVKVMQEGIVYKNKYQEKELLFYCNLRKKGFLEEKVEMIAELFLPLGYELRTFWESHFAVLGCDQTMEIDQMEIL